jgi:hypothetical protein
MGLPGTQYDIEFCNLQKTERESPCDSSRG